MKLEELRFSRAIASAIPLSEVPHDVHRFVEKRILLTGDTETLLAPNGRDIAHATLLLLMRGCRNVTVALPLEAGHLAKELAASAQEHAWDEIPRVCGMDVALEDFDAILSIGFSVRPDLPWTAINSNGWLARVSSGPTSLARKCSNKNVIGALAAASLGAAEVFKRLIRLRQDRGALLDATSFSLWTYGCGSEDPGPVLPATFAVNLLVAGAGAIGSAITYLLARLPLSGHVTVVDKQDYAPENWGTCIGLRRNQVGLAKAYVAAETLRSGAKGFRKTIGELNDMELASTAPWPTVALGGLDDIDARHDLQRLWPDLVIDGAIGANLSVQMSCHPWEANAACLICSFRHPPGESAEVVQRRLTGLSREALRAQDRFLSEEDVATAAPVKRAWLKSQIGKRVCSVVAEAQELSEGALAATFRPSAPFAASLSASMIVTELCRYLVTGQSWKEERFQLNMLVGPGMGISVPQGRRPDCECVTRVVNIERFRAARQDLTSLSTD